MFENALRLKLGLTEQGAKDAGRSVAASFWSYVVAMAAVAPLLLVIGLLTGEIGKEWLWPSLTLAVVSLAVMYPALRWEYEAMYVSTYRESGNLRKSIVRKLSLLPLPYFSRKDLSDLSQTVMSDVEGLEHALSHAVPKVGGLALFYPIVAAALLAGNFKLGLVCVAPSVLGIMAIALTYPLQLKARQKNFDAARRNSEAIQEAIELNQEIRAFGLGEETRAKLNRLVEESEKMTLKTESLLMALIGVGFSLQAIAPAAALAYGAALCAQGQCSVLMVLAYFLAALKLRESMDIASELIAELYAVVPKAERIKALDADLETGGQDAQFDSFDVEFKGVEFAYQSRPVLRQVDFIARQGQSTALVGKSGCGKTTALRLASRLLECDRGEILVGGKNVKDVSAESLFKHVSVVFQDVTLFNASALENIRVGRPEATDEEVRQAAKLAGCDEFAEKLENGYDTLIGENGSSLSGGERQRLSIARALLKNAPILLLDEIASSLDAANEKKVQDGINKLIQGKTVIVVSHRLKSIEKADKIVVFDEGEVQAEGKAGELAVSSPLYGRLVEKSGMAEQFRY